MSLNLKVLIRKGEESVFIASTEYCVNRGIEVKLVYHNLRDSLPKQSSIFVTKEESGRIKRRRLRKAEHNFESLRMMDAYSKSFQ